MPVQPDLIARGLGALPSMLDGATPPRYRVFIRDAQYRRIDELTDWISLSLVLRFNGVGTWALEMSADSVSAPLLARTGGIVVTREVEGVERTIFSGAVGTEWAWTAKTFRAAGESDDAQLRTPVRPSPDQEDGPYPDEYDVRTGVASTVMIEYLKWTIGQFAPSGWQNPYLFVWDDPLLGGTVTGRGRFQPLLSLLQEIAVTPISGGLGFRLRQSDVYAGYLDFEVYQPQDRSADAKFSIALGTAQDYEDVWRAPAANYAFVLLGDGLGNARTVLQGGDADSIAELGRRIATVVDMRGVTDPGEGEQRLAEVLAGAVSSRRAAITPFDVPSLQYGQDYDLGTLVTVVGHDGEEFVDLVREVEIELDPEKGALVTPIIGEAGADGDALTAQYIASVQDRLSNVERNWTVPDDSIIRAMLAAVVKPPIGQVVAFAGATLPDGWLWCDGSAVSRTTYALLFAALGGAGSPWGSGDGSTTFNVPNVEDRVILGAGNLYALAATGGAASANLAHTHAGGTLAYAHTHSTPDHAHPHTHATPAHAHSHTHTGPSHSHAGPSHTHTTDINHDHGAFTSGFQAGATVAVGAATPAAGTWDHRHTIDVPALGTSTITSSASGTADTGLGGTGATGSALDSASSGSGTSGSALDTAASGAGTTGAAGSTSWSGASGSNLTTQSLLPPYVAMPAIIYAGV